MADLLSGTLLFLVAVFSHWQIWLSGSGVGGFLVIASSLIERLTGKSLSRKTHLLIFVVAFFLCSCIIAWIDEHDRGMRLEGQLRIANGSFAKYRTDCEKQMSDKQNDFLGQIGDLQRGVAVKEAVSQTLQKQNRDQQSTINGCLSQAMKLMTPEPLKISPLVLDNEEKDGIKKVRWLVLTNKTITPVQMNVVCNKVLEGGASVWIVGSGMLGGGAGKMAPNIIGVNIATPAWATSSPLLVSMSYRGKEDDLTCSFQLR